MIGWSFQNSIFEYRRVYFVFFSQLYSPNGKTGFMQRYDAGTLVCMFCE